MSRISRAACAIGILLLCSTTVKGEELPTSLTCRSNAKASRDYAFREKRWEGRKGRSGVASTSLFDVGTRDSKVAGIFYSLRDKVFSGLDTSTPIVRSITRFADGDPDRGEEFTANVISRQGHAVILLWSNGFNKTWLAIIDLTYQKAAVTQVFQGLTSVGGDIETLDCN